MHMKPPPQMTLKLMSDRLQSTHQNSPARAYPSLLSVLDSMRSQGAIIGAPQSAPIKAPENHTAWKITVCVKDAQADLLFFVPDDHSTRRNA